MSEATANQRPLGHVTPNADGYLARCGGPKIRKVCMQELAALKHPISDGADPLTLSSPERIYLIVGDECPRDSKFSDLADVTWCEDDAGGGIEYVRADLKARARLGNAVVIPERWNVPRPIWKDVQQPYGDPLNKADIDAAEAANLIIDEVARLNPSRGVPDSAFTSRAITHYEAALQAAFPSGSSGEVFSQWNEARKVLSAAPPQPDQCAGVVVLHELVLEAIDVLMLYTRGSASREGILINDLRALLAGGEK